MRDIHCGVNVGETNAACVRVMEGEVECAAVPARREAAGSQLAFNLADQDSLFLLFAAGSQALA
jgi:hypothetical protein